MNEIKKLTKTTIIYFLGTVGTKVVSFLLLPLYTSYITPSDYGTYDLNIAYATLFASFFYLDIWAGIMKFIFEKKEERDQKKVIYSGILIFFLSSVLYFAFMGGFGYLKRIQYLPGVMAYGFFMCLQSLYSYLARSFGYNLRFAISGMAATACSAVLNIIMLVLWGMKYNSLYLAYSIGIILQCTILEYKMRIIPHFRLDLFDKDIIQELFRFSLPLCINSLCYWLLTGFNRIIINQRLDSVANGYYAVAAKFGGILVIVSSCFTMAWQELAYKKFGRDDETGNFYSQATNLYIKALLCGFMILVPMIYIVFPFLIDNGYEEARNLIPLSMMATMASILSGFLGNIISTYKKNNAIFISTFCACLVNILILYLLIDFMGVEATNIALLVGYLVGDGIRIWMISREVKYKLDFKLLLYMLPTVIVVNTVYRNGGLLWNCVLLLGSVIISVYVFRTMISKIITNIRSRY